jgi:Microcystin-dependent protein
MSIESQSMRSRIVVRQLRKGTNGFDGWTPVIANIRDDKRFVMQVTNWIGGQGIKPETGYYIGESGFVENMSEAVDIRGVGQKGWSPILAADNDGERRVLQVYNWIGGEGEKPNVGQYIGPYGLVDSPLLAINIRGERGTEGPDGPTGPQGPMGAVGPYAPGEIVWLATKTIPAGRRLLKANGSQNLSRVLYPELFAVVRTMYGAGDGVTTFGIPDLRGEFTRGFDDGRGVDAGRVFGSLQAQSMQTHYHKTSIGFDNNNFYGHQDASGNPAFGSDTVIGNRILAEGALIEGAGMRRGYTSTASVTGSETRPRNVALLACITY